MLYLELLISYDQWQSCLFIVFLCFLNGHLSFVYISVYYIFFWRVLFICSHSLTPFFAQFDTVRLSEEPIARGGLVWLALRKGKALTDAPQDAKEATQATGVADHPIHPWKSQGPLVPILGRKTHETPKIFWFGSWTNRFLELAVHVWSCMFSRMYWWDWWMGPNL